MHSSHITVIKHEASDGQITLLLSLQPIGQRLRLSALISTFTWESQCPLCTVSVAFFSATSAITLDTQQQPTLRLADSFSLLNTIAYVVPCLSLCSTMTGIPMKLPQGMVITLRQQVNLDRHCTQGDHCPFGWSGSTDAPNFGDARRGSKTGTAQRPTLNAPRFPSRCKIDGNTTLSLCVDMIVTVCRFSRIEQSTKPVPLSRVQGYT
jgi:hypothetical protein